MRRLAALLHGPVDRCVHRLQRTAGAPLRGQRQPAQQRRTGQIVQRPVPLDGPGRLLRDLGPYPRLAPENGVEQRLHRQALHLALVVDDLPGTPTVPDFMDVRGEHAGVAGHAAVGECPPEYVAHLPVVLAAVPRHAGRRNDSPALPGDERRENGLLDHEHLADEVGAEQRAEVHARKPIEDYLSVGPAQARHLPPKITEPPEKIADPPALRTGRELRTSVFRTLHCPSFVS